MSLQQGDIVRVDFNPAIGHEPMKRRYAVVVSTGYFNDVVSSLVAVCPITSRDNVHPLHVALPEKGMGDIRGFICTEQMRTLDPKARELAGTGLWLDQRTMDEVLKCIGSIFGI